jgi:hypothetical protein
LWVAALATGAKSFVDNPIIGSERLNRAGLHVARVKAAHKLAWRRRRRIARGVKPEWREQFDRNGFVCVPDFLPPEMFAKLRATLLETRFESRAHQQGDTITRRVPVGPEVLQASPELGSLLGSTPLTSLLSYVASTRSVPLYYVQTIVGSATDGPPDPQVELHSDTFHPSLKAWLFLTDVADEDRPLTYVAGSHRLTPQRLAWEKEKSISLTSSGDRLSQRGSFRISPDGLARLDLPAPTRFAVKANTLVAVDTYGFHARGDSDHPTLRVELWAYCRRTPFLPWAGLDLLSIGPIAPRRAQWLNWLVDRLAGIGWLTQHWKPVGHRRPIDP